MSEDVKVKWKRIRSCPVDLQEKPERRLLIDVIIWASSHVAERNISDMVNAISAGTAFKNQTSSGACQNSARAFKLLVPVLTGKEGPACEPHWVLDAGIKTIFSPVDCVPSPRHPEQLSYIQYHSIHCNRHYLSQSAFWVPSLSPNKLSLRHQAVGELLMIYLASQWDTVTPQQPSQCPSTSSPWRGCWPCAALAKALIVVWAQWLFFTQHL